MIRDVPHGSKFIINDGDCAEGRTFGSMGIETVLRSSKRGSSRCMNVAITELSVLHVCDEPRSPVPSVLLVFCNVNVCGDFCMHCSHVTGFRSRVCLGKVLTSSKDLHENIEQDIQMLKRIVKTLKPHVRNLYSHSSTPTRNGVTLSLISTAMAGTALWYFNAHNVYNDAAEPMEPKKKVQAPGTTGTPSDPNTIYSLVWGSNRLAFW